MADFKPTSEQELLIDDLVAHYSAKRELIERFLDGLHAHISKAESLAPLIHSVKYRMKDPTHLREKLVRKLHKAQQSATDFNINKENLFTEINDLAGYRILHLHTRQMEKINPALLEVLNEAHMVIEGPRASIWDQESEAYFQGIGIQTEYHPRMYSSVHYVVQPISKSKVTIEIQVRTLSEEIWGEVDHRFNYPQPIDSVACREQIKVLARVASSCTRLVDSIFASYAALQSEKKVEQQDKTGTPTAAQAPIQAAEPNPGDTQ